MYIQQAHYLAEVVTNANHLSGHTAIGINNRHIISDTLLCAAVDLEIILLAIDRIGNNLCLFCEIFSHHAGGIVPDGIGNEV